MTIAKSTDLLDRYLPTHLPIGVYEITLNALDPIELSSFSAATLRGAFGWTFKRMVCYQPQVKNCRGCLLASQCAYPKVFEPAPRQDTLLSGLQNVPAPYVLRPPTDGKRQFERGEHITFQLVLIGDAIRLLGYFAVALQQLETQGLGRGRGRAEIKTISALHPSGNDDERLSLFASGNLQMHPGWSAQAWVQGVAAPSQLQIEFLTAARLKSDGQVQSIPEFHVLYRALLRRASALCAHHTARPWETDFAALASEARSIQMVDASMTPSQHRRVSRRQGSVMEVWGRVGRLVYQGDLKPFWPLLQLGTVLHVGKNCTFGLGQYRLSIGEDNG